MALWQMEWGFSVRVILLAVGVRLVEQILSRIFYAVSETNLKRMRIFSFGRAYYNEFFGACFEWFFSFIAFIIAATWARNESDKMPISNGLQSNCLTNILYFVWRNFELILQQTKAYHGRHTCPLVCLLLVSKCLGFYVIRCCRFMLIKMFV